MCIVYLFRDIHISMWISLFEQELLVACISILVPDFLTSSREAFNSVISYNDGCISDKYYNYLFV